MSSSPLQDGCLEINDDGMHGRVDDMLSADRAIERVVVGLEFDGAHGTKSYPKKPNIRPQINRLVAIVTRCYTSWR